MIAGSASAIACAARSGRCALFEELDRGIERRFVLGHERRDARPGFPGADRILALLLVQAGDRLLGRDARLDVGDELGFLLENAREIVPAIGALEQALEARATVFALRIEREQLFESGDRAVRIAQLRLRKPGDLAQPADALLDVDAVVSRCAAQHVAELGELSQLLQVRLEERDGVEVRGLDREHLAVLLGGVVLARLARERRRLLDEQAHLIRSVVRRHRARLPTPPAASAERTDETPRDAAHGRRTLRAARAAAAPTESAGRGAARARALRRACAPFGLAPAYAAARAPTSSRRPSSPP